MKSKGEILKELRAMGMDYKVKDGKATVHVLFEALPTWLAPTFEELAERDATILVVFPSGKQMEVLDLATEPQDAAEPWDTAEPEKKSVLALVPETDKRRYKKTKANLTITADRATAGFYLNMAACAKYQHKEGNKFAVAIVDGSLQIKVAKEGYNVISVCGKYDDPPGYQVSNGKLRRWFADNNIPRGSKMPVVFLPETQSWIANLRLPQRTSNITPIAGLN